MHYDEDVDKIVTDKMFKGFRFSNDSVDHNFKKTFINQFIYRQIMTQTLDLFATKVLRITLQHEQYIEILYQDFDKFLTNQGNEESNSQNESENENDETSTQDTRNLRSTLPQDDINMNVDNSEMSYADENSIDKQKNKGNTKGNERGSQQNQSQSISYNVGTLKEMRDLFTDLFDIYDQHCFLHVW